MTQDPVPNWRLLQFSLTSQFHNPGPFNPPTSLPKIPSALNLPGTWPRDSSPMRSSQSRPVANNTPFDISQPPPAIARPATAVPRSEKSKKRASRPASRAGGESVWSHTTTGRKADLSQLLASINVGPQTPTEEEDRMLSNGSKTKVFKPPYWFVEM